MVSKRLGRGILLLLKIVTGSFMLKFCPSAMAKQVKQKCATVLGQGKNEEECENYLHRIIAFGMLFMLCLEYSEDPGETLLANRYTALSRLFLTKLETELSKLPLILTPSMEAVSALTISVSHRFALLHRHLTSTDIAQAAVAVDMCKPHFALYLTTIAVSLALSLGYNRMSSMLYDSVEEREQKLFLFWILYVFDTSFSIRLGRSSAIRDHDIAVPLLSDNGSIPQVLVHVLHNWIELGRVQCQIVEQLYSPPALGQPIEQRSKSASELATRLQEIWAARNQVSIEELLIGRPKSSMSLLSHSDAITHYSTLALVQHATDTTQNRNSPALDTSRHALWLSVDVWLKHKSLNESAWSTHCHWSLLNAPFTPFTVVFCYVIANPADSAADFRLLCDFVDGLRSSTHLSAGIAKLHHFCDMFRKVAELYVEKKAGGSVQADMQTFYDENQPQTTQQINSDIDEYLSALGFLEPTQNHFAGSDLARMSHEDQLHAAFMSNWFHGNTALVGASEQCFTYLDQAETDG